MCVKEQLSICYNPPLYNDRPSRPCSIYFNCLGHWKVTVKIHIFPIFSHIYMVIAHFFWVLCNLTIQLAAETYTSGMLVSVFYSSRRQFQICFTVSQSFTSLVFLFLMLLGIEPRASHILDKCSAIELTSTVLTFFNFTKWVFTLGYDLCFSRQP